MHGWASARVYGLGLGLGAWVGHDQCEDIWARARARCMCEGWLGLGLDAWVGQYEGIWVRSRCMGGSMRGYMG